MREPFASPSISSAQGTGQARCAKRPLARSHGLRVSFLCLLALSAPRAAAASNVIVARAGAPGESSKAWYGFEIGPTFSLPLPAASASHDEIGIDFGLSCTLKLSPNAGIGADIAYHYWPVSAEFKQQFNGFLSEHTLNTLELGGGTWGPQVAQYGLHIRVAPVNARGVRPWLQLGASAYRVQPNISGYSGDAGFFTVTAPPPQTTQHFGYSLAVGTDLFGGPSARMGLDATYHFVNSSDRYGVNLRVFTLGAHVLFGL